MSNSENDKKSNVLKRMTVRLYADKDEDIADYLSKQKNITLNAFVKFLLREAMDKFGEEDYLKAISDHKESLKYRMQSQEQKDTNNKKEILSKNEIDVSPSSTIDMKSDFQKQKRKETQDLNTLKPRRNNIRQGRSSEKHKKLPQDPFDIFKDGNNFE